jgi:hypothetical protein
MTDHFFKFSPPQNLAFKVKVEVIQSYLQAFVMNVSGGVDELVC